MLVTNCGVSRNVAELGVSQMALMLSVEKKTVLETEKKFKCEKSLKIQLIFFFFSLFLVQNK